MGRWNRALLLAVLVLCVFFTGGCTFVKAEKEDTTSLDYTIVREEDIPQELARLIDEKKEKEFQMTYKSEDFLYLLRGYGQQMSGGYSIEVEELSLGKEAVFLKTRLLGPGQGEKQSREPSYPYIVIKMPYRQEPVKFL
ncbi:MAG: protease complex subunit PrcB family protein [Eubacteriales bacterium]|nr:protease complex subunit PrcB family protein [Eubacteriales bacterium]